MQITPRPEETIDKLVMEASPPRSPGLHLSSIIKSLNHDLDPKRFTSESDYRVLPLVKWEIGFSFERVLELAFQSRRIGIFRPEEIEKDGIAMSPDGIDPEDWRLEEFKSTEMSMLDAPEAPKFRHWFWQMEAYCLGLETRLARLRVLFLRGDYRAMREPQYRVWDIEFTQQELEENWLMLLHHARQKGML